MARSYPGDGWDDEGPPPRPSVAEVTGSSPTVVSPGTGADRSVDRVTAGAYERHAAEIHAFVLRIVRDPDAAADLVADTFTKLLVEEQAGRTPLQPRPWLYRVAANLATSRGRRIRTALRTSHELERRESRETAPSPEGAVLDRERDDELHRALAELGVRERTALLLAAAGYEGDTIATLIGRSHGATRALMCRARKRLRAALREQDVA